MQKRTGVIREVAFQAEQNGASKNNGYFIYMLRSPLWNELVVGVSG